MPYLLFLKKRQNLKLSSAAKCRWHFTYIGPDNVAFEFNTPVLKKIDHIIGILSVPISDCQSGQSSLNTLFI